MERKNEVKLTCYSEEEKHGQIFITRELYFKVIAKQSFYLPNYKFYFPDGTV